MALTAEVRGLLGGLRNQLVQIRRRSKVVTTGDGSRQVRIDPLMAVRALHARL